MRAEIANKATAMRSEMDKMKADIKDVEGGLSTWSDGMVATQNTVTSLKKQVEDLKEKCDNLEGRMRRSNILIAGVAETTGSSSTAAVSKLLKEVLQMERDLRADWSHRSLAPWKPGGRPRVKMAKMHHFQDCIDILRRAREGAPLRFNGEPVAIYPDYTASVARARAAFSDVKKVLCGRQGIRYGVLFPARLYITYKDLDQEFVDPVKAMEFVNRHFTQTAERE